MIQMTIDEFEEFKKEWEKVCESLKNSGYDLSRIRIRV